MAVVVRYLVADVDTAIAFYTAHLGFTLQKRWGTPFASLQRGALELWLSGPASSAARPTVEGAEPAPGGWNRMVIEVEDLAAAAAALQGAGASLHGAIVSGPGGAQLLVRDPSGNPVELFQPRR